MKKVCSIVLAISVTLLLLLTLCACESKTSDSPTSSNSSSLFANNDSSKNSGSNESSNSTQGGNVSDTSRSLSTEPSTMTQNTSNTAKTINTYEELIAAPVGTVVTVEGVSTQSAFDRAWAGTHYKFTMTFGESKNDEIYIDMSTDKKAQDIVRGTRVSVTGKVTGLKGASGGREVPEVQLDSYKVLS